MKLILLPGMDGTGILFDLLLASLQCPCQIMPLPAGDDQSYRFLTDYVEPKLPNEDFILLAESFSGPIAAQLATRDLPHLRGVIFLATFLIAPKPALLRLARFISPKRLMRLPLAHYFIRKLFVGWDYPVARFSQALDLVTAATLKARIRTLERLMGNELSTESTLPALLLVAQNDIFVTNNQLRTFKKYFPNLCTVCVPGTHFLAQSNPSACALHINSFLHGLAS